MEKIKTKMRESISDWWAAFIGGATFSTFKFYQVMDIQIQLININWSTVFYDILRSTPWVLVGGFLGVIVKKAAEDFYSFCKEKIKNHFKNHKDGTDTQ